MFGINEIEDMIKSEKIKPLLNINNPDIISSAIYYAAKYKKAYIIHYMCKGGINPNFIFEHENKSPLMASIESGDLLTFKALIKCGLKYKNILKLALLDANGKPERADVYDIVIYLIKSGEEITPEIEELLEIAIGKGFNNIAQHLTGSMIKRIKKISFNKKIKLRFDVKKSLEELVAYSNAIETYKFQESHGYELSTKEKGLIYNLRKVYKDDKIQLNTKLRNLSDPYLKTTTDMIETLADSSDFSLLEQKKMFEIKCLNKEKLLALITNLMEVLTKYYRHHVVFIPKY